MENPTIDLKALNEALKPLGLEVGETDAPKQEETPPSPPKEETPPPPKEETPPPPKQETPPPVEEETPPPIGTPPDTSKTTLTGESIMVMTPEQVSQNMDGIKKFILGNGGF